MRRRYYHRDTRTIEQPPAALHHVLMGRNLTPEQRYSFDCLGYLVIPDAIEPALLVQLQRLMVEREHCALSAAAADNPPSCLRHQRATDGRLIEASWMNVLDEDTAMLDLIANPGVLAYVQSMVDRPILEQFILSFRWEEGEVNAHAGHVPYQAINSYQVSDGRIYNNHLRVMYYMKDVTPGQGQGGIQIIPGKLAWNRHSTMRVYVCVLVYSYSSSMHVCSCCSPQGLTKPTSNGLLVEAHLCLPCPQRWQGSL